MDFDEIADELYGLPPEEFTSTRDERVAAAREAGDRELATKIGKLRKPTQAAWLANLLTRNRGAELDGLLGLAASLRDAQRSLDGETLRTLSTQRNQLVSAMSRQGRALARAAGHVVAESVERELSDILEAALADPEVAKEVRSGRLTKTLRYSGFGPPAPEGAPPRPAPRAEPAGAEDAPGQARSADRAGRTEPRDGRGRRGQGPGEARCRRGGRAAGRVEPRRGPRPGHRADRAGGGSPARGERGRPAGPGGAAGTAHLGPERAVRPDQAAAGPRPAGTAHGGRLLAASG